MAALQRTRDRRTTGEQAALRRVATLVARAAPPEKVFAAVTTEAGRLLGVHQATMGRYVPDGMVVVAAWGEAGATFPVDSWWSLAGRNAPTLVYRTGQPARTDDYSDVSDPITEAAGTHGLRSLVGVPISVEGRLWGVMLVGSTQEEPLPPGTEARLTAFTELAATAIASAQARADLRGFADEQAALRRVATLVARGTAPDEVFATVAAEVGRLLGVDFTFLSRYSPGHSATIVGAWARTGTAGALSAGSRWGIGGWSGRWSSRYWRGAGRARRRIERDLHDGAQQRLVSLALQLREASTTVPSGAGELARQLEDAVTDVTSVLDELRETARGLHPAILAEGGLRPALAALARRSAVPVRLDVQTAVRLPEQVEIAAYYVAAEALTNTAKHAHATAVDVEVTAGEHILRVRVSDDGLGGAAFGRGSGLVGLRDRTEALGGQIWLHSPPGVGTVLEITLPVGGLAGPRPPPAGD